MTSKLKNRKLSTTKKLFAPFLCLGLTALTVIFGEEVKASVYQGFLFSFTTIIPALFPFFILSDLWSYIFIPDKNSKIGAVFEKIFRINRVALPAFFSGLVCGFPIGVKSASLLFEEEKISDDEFERLSGFANNPSLAFVVFGVGGGILGNVKYGIILYICVIISSVFTGIVFRSKEYKSVKSDNNFGQNFNFVESVKNAGISSINVSSYIIFFTCLTGLISKLVSEKSTALISTLLEVANSAKLISLCPSFDFYTKMSLLAFAVGFSGLSVHMQALSYLPKKFPFKKYFVMKTIQGIVCFGVMCLFLIFI